MQFNTAPDDINLVVIITISSLLALLLGILCRNMFFLTAKYANESIGTVIPLIKMSKYQKKPVRTFERFFDSILPLEFKLSSRHLIWLSLLIHHELSSMRTKYIKTQYSITEKLLLMTNKLVSYLLINTVLNLFVYGNQDQCMEYLTPSKCTEPPVLLITGSICVWSSADNSCGFREDVKTISDSNSFVNMIVLVAVMSMVTSLTARAMVFLMIHAKLGIKSGLWSCCGVGTTTSESSLSGLNTKPRNTNKVVPYSGSVHNQYSHHGGEEKHGRDEYSAVFDQLEELGDELLLAQSRKTTLIRAVCFAIMKRNIDYLPADQELRLMLRNKLNKWSWIQLPPKTLSDSSNEENVANINRIKAFSYYCASKFYAFYDIGDPARLLQMVEHGHIFNQAMLEDKLVRSRHLANQLRSEVLKIRDVEEQDAFLTQQFLTWSLLGYKRKVVEVMLFHSAAIAAVREDRLGWQYLSLLLIPLYLLGGLLFSAFYGMRIDAQSSAMWLASLLIVIVQDFVCIQPLKILIKNVWIPRTARVDYLALHTVLSVRARTIFTRHTGLLRNINCVVQHYNPACRAARLVPALSSARMLMSLTDYDLPVQQLLDRLRPPFVADPIQRMDKRTPLVYDCLATLKNNLVTRSRILKHILGRAVENSCGLCIYLLLCLPEWTQHVALEWAIVIGINALIAGLYFAAHTNIALTVVVVLVVVLLIVWGIRTVLRTVDVDPVQLATGRQDAAGHSLDSVSNKEVRVRKKKKSKVVLKTVVATELKTDTANSSKAGLMV